MWERPGATEVEVALYVRSLAAAEGVGAGECADAGASAAGGLWGCRFLGWRGTGGGSKR